MLGCLARCDAHFGAGQSRVVRLALAFLVVLERSLRLLALILLWLLLRVPLMLVERLTDDFEELFALSRLADR